MESAVEKMDSFFRIKKNTHLPIRDGIQEAKKELGALRYDIEDTVCYLDSFEYLMRDLMVKKIKEVKPSKTKEVVEEAFQNARETSPCAPRSDAHQTGGGDELRVNPARAQKARQP